MAPQFLPVVRKRRETKDSVTLDIASEGRGFRPGQFNMLYVFGVGEIPISMSGNAARADRFVHTVRSVGAASAALSALRPKELVGVRGPFGTGWPVDEARGKDVLIVAGGIGLAPLRPVIYHVLDNRQDYGRVGLLYGARNPADLLFRRELDQWRSLPGFQARVTVDRSPPDWRGDVGVVTKILPKMRIDPADTVAMICGPEVMMRFTATALGDLGMRDEQIYVSTERNMKCAVGFCGHCQYGPHFICKDGPVFRYDVIRSLFSVREI